jgi:multidrug efflux system outer membrane protein
VRNSAGGPALAMLLTLFTGCEVGRNYHQPAIPVDQHFGGVQEPGLLENAAIEKYWIAFDDELLDSLVDDALAHNNDLAAAEATVARCRPA